MRRASPEPREQDTTMSHGENGPRGGTPSRRINRDFAAVDLEQGFSPREGGVAGITEKILASDFDPARRTGSRTRLLRLAPGTRTPGAHAHDYREELYVLEGDMTVGDGRGGERLVRAPAYACREPGFMHGPVRTDAGCLLLEISSYPRPESASPRDAGAAPVAASRG
jgi:quercetin dioxygenase-like cupin family protein